jgi:sugar phosphate isomerase/epimerase
MRFGICTKASRAGEVRTAGADFVEENVQTFLRGLVEDAEWQGTWTAPSALPVSAANSLVPGDLKIVGPVVDFERLQKYIANVTVRAQRVGIKILVFGSGGARNVPDGFDRAKAQEQIVAFCKMAADACARTGITLVAEPLNKGECNIINTVGEAMTYVRQVNHKSFQCLADSYHFWMENEQLSELEAAAPWVRHVHVADLEGRVAAGESGKSDYRPFFRVLKRAKYAGAISVEALNFNDFETVGKRVIAFLHRQWDEA